MPMNTRFAPFYYILGANLGSLLHFFRDEKPTTLIVMCMFKNYKSLFGIKHKILVNINLAQILLSSPFLLRDEAFK